MTSASASLIRLQSPGADGDLIHTACDNKRAVVSADAGHGDGIAVGKHLELVARSPSVIKQAIGGIETFG
jgi:hypothetical protein